MKIEAQVATVLTPYKVALNKGRGDGVELDAVVNIWNVVEVRDPGNGRLLGSSRLSKLRLNVVEVDDEFCIAEVKQSPISVNLFPANMFSGLDDRKRIVVNGEPDDVEVVPGEDATIEVLDTLAEAEPK